MSTTTTASRSITVAVAGNPNCGKTTVFNGLTGGRQQIGNWPGVTVEKKEGRFTGGEPDLVVDVIDASNIERNLYLTMQLAEMGLPVVAVLTMIDVAEKKAIRIDVDRLREALGIPVIAINALHRGEVERLKADLIEIAHRGLGEIRNPPRPSYPPPLEDAIAKVGGDLDDDDLARRRWRAVRLLEGERSIPYPRNAEPVIEEAADEAERALGEELDVVFADSRYEMIQRITSECVRRGTVRQNLTEQIDRVVIHRLLGFPIFLAAMFVVFWFTISVGGAFIDFFDIVAGGIFVDGLGSLLGTVGTPDWLVAVIADGVGGGLQTVATFIPVIFAMFFALAILEDSGYMARAAFVMDRLMRWIGLPGKSFVPMLLGFGCTIPAVMATKTLESRRDRLMTIFMTPLMSCGARLPVYALVATAIFGSRAGLVVFSIYVIGIALAVLTGLVMRSTLFAGTASHFVLELPPYHAPRMGQILAASGRRLSAFIRRAGTTIVIMVSILGFVNAVTVDENGIGFGGDSARSLLAYAGRAVTPVFGPMGIEDDNWPATVAIFAGLFAKEAAVGTLNSIYLQQIDRDGRSPSPDGPGAGGAAEDAGAGFDPVAIVVDAVSTIPRGLAAAVGAAGDGIIATEEARTFPVMRDRFSLPAAYAFLLFVLVYFPCVSALGVVIREIGAGYGWLLAGYLTVSAWAISTIVFQTFGGGAIGWTGVGVAVLVLEWAILRLIGRRARAAARAGVPNRETPDRMRR